MACRATNVTQVSLQTKPQMVTKMVTNEITNEIQRKIKTKIKRYIQEKRIYKNKKRAQVRFVYFPLIISFLDHFSIIAVI